MLNSWWTQSILETYRFKLFFSVTNFGNQNISKSILEVYFIFRVQKHIWSIAQFQHDKTNKSLHNFAAIAQWLGCRSTKPKTSFILKRSVYEYQEFLGTWCLKVSPHSDSVAYRQMKYIHKVVHQDKWTLKMGHNFFVQYTSEVQLKYT